MLGILLIYNPPRKTNREIESYVCKENRNSRQSRESNIAYPTQKEQPSLHSGQSFSALSYCLSYPVVELGASLPLASLLFCHLDGLLYLHNSFSCNNK